MFLSIIIPIYNEEIDLKKNIKEVCNFFSSKFFFEVIVVNDGSTDNSLEILDVLDIPNLKIIDQEGTNAYDLLKYKNVIFTRGTSFK